ncbi:MAG: DUF3179 domain-containing (seleno)protein, partial [Verrucomicrobiota bacterium]
NTGHDRPYRGTAYKKYFSNDHLIFPVQKKTKRPRHFKNKELMAVVYSREAAKAYAVTDVKKALGQRRTSLIDQLGGRRIRVTYVKEGDTIRIEPADNGDELPVAYMFWFALSALQPEIELFRDK